MDIRRSIKALLLIALSSVFLIGSMANAGGSEIAPETSWIFYIGPFAGIYTGSFAYRATLFTNIPVSEFFNDNIHQYGYSYGAQTGVNYHIQASRVFVGLYISIMGNTENAQDAYLVIAATAINAPQSVRNTFRLNYNDDFSTLLGVRILSRTDIYLKIGTSYAQFSQTLDLITASLTTPSIRFRQVQRVHMWGSIVGFGLLQHIDELISLFGEYDFYYFGGRNLLSTESIRSPIVPASHASHYTQNVNVRSYSVRVGFNFNVAI